MEDYKRKYEKLCNVKIPKNYEIHHIDMDRTNNNIYNLVMLPKELHQQYHTLREKMENNFYINYSITSILDSGNGINELSNIYYKEFIKVIGECNKYADYRDYLLGLIPNIHRTSKEEIWKK